MHDQSGVIPKETFRQLLSESRKAWSQLSDDVRVDILWALQANGSQCSQEYTRMPSLHDKPRYNQTQVPQNATQASTTSGRNRRLRIYLQQIYVRCYPNVKDQTSHQS
jgi:hypothetical protein